MKQVLILSDHRDAHIPFVTRHLGDRYIIVDPIDLMKGSALSFYPGEKGTNIIYQDMELSDIRGVWYRKPQPIPEDELPIENEYKPYSRSALERHFSLLLSAFPKATWIPDYFVSQRADSKLLQLETARQVGFAVPETIFTNSPQSARAFLSKHDKHDHITKPLSNIHPVIKGRRRVFLTRPIKRHAPPDFSQLHLAPAIFQQAIMPVRDIRVTVVSEQVFAAQVQSEPSKERKETRDSRAGYYKGKVHIREIDDLPDIIARHCIAQTKAMGLKVGAIDLVQDAQDTYWFLEINTNGQWAFIEEATGQPIGEAVAKLLTQKIQ